jgi:hypothetical protein
MSRKNSARRKKSTFKKQSGVRPWMGYFNNHCGCHNCRGARQSVFGIAGL